jgi:hypothetical protein
MDIIIPLNKTSVVFSPVLCKWFRHRKDWEKSLISLTQIGNFTSDAKYSLGISFILGDMKI